MRAYSFFNATFYESVRLFSVSSHNIRTVPFVTQLLVVNLLYKILVLGFYSVKFYFHYKILL